MSDSLRPHGAQHARLLCPSPPSGVCSDSCLLSQFSSSVMWEIAQAWVSQGTSAGSRSRGWTIIAALRVCICPCVPSASTTTPVSVLIPTPIPAPTTAWKQEQAWLADKISWEILSPWGETSRLQPDKAAGGSLCSVSPVQGKRNTQKMMIMGVLKNLLLPAQPRTIFTRQTRKQEDLLFRFKWPREPGSPHAGVLVWQSLR